MRRAPLHICADKPTLATKESVKLTRLVSVRRLTRD